MMIWVAAIGTFQTDAVINPAPPITDHLTIPATALRDIPHIKADHPHYGERRANINFKRPVLRSAAAGAGTFVRPA